MVRIELRLSERTLTPAPPLLRPPPPSPPLSLPTHAGIERRLSEWTLTPVHSGEGLQVLRYRKDQKYDAVRV